MSSNQQLRQTELFAGEDWTVLYRAFTQINFNASDPVSINQALQSYIQTNYPEDFNDWIERSEFVALIDLISWIAGTLAFRTDINARENFLETAQARESVLRLARFLSYNARRAQSARGLVKLTNVKTSQSVLDSFGVNLNNTTINWNDPDNPDWLEQFVVILNAAFPTTNPFGIPLKSEQVSSITTQLYAVNNQPNSSCVYQFDASVNGNSDTFEIVNMDFDTTGFSELQPDPNQPFHMAYRNDGLGNGSNRTGFFLFFKQGSLKQTTYSFSDAIENRTLDVSTNNISQTDVWFQSLDGSSNITEQWTPVPAVITDNITFNSVTPSIRSIFSVTTRDNDQITLRFGDGTFGEVPVGNLRLWYRTVNGLQYQLRTTDMQNKTISIPYYDVTGRSQTLTLTFTLQDAITNAVSSETIDDIRRRAPQAFAAQNRMVSGEDYNVYPLTSNEIVKMHAVNRIYSGHSRYLDINDPTSTYQDTVVYSDDGLVYLMPSTQYIQVPTTANLTPEQITLNKLQPLLDDITVRDYFLNLWMASSAEFRDADGFDYGMDVESTFTNGSVNAALWTSSIGSGYSAVGSFLFDDTTLDAMRVTLQSYLSVGSLLKFQWNDLSTGSPITTFKWVEVLQTAVFQNTSSSINLLTLNSAALTLSDSIPDGAALTMVCPAFRATLANQLGVSQSVTELQQAQNRITNKSPFDLYYQFNVNTVLQAGTQLQGTWLNMDQGVVPAAVAGINAEFVASVRYLGAMFWTIEIKAGTKFIFQSANNVQWYNDNTTKIIDANTGLTMRDHITFLDPQFKQLSLDIASSMYESDGFIDPARVVVTPTDSDDDGSPDNPEVFAKILNSSEAVNDGYIFFLGDPTTQDSNAQPQLDLPYYSFTGVNGQSVWPPIGWQDLTVGTGVFYYNSTITPANSGFYVYNGTNAYTNADLSTGDYTKMKGAANLQFQWKHYAGLDSRIDPAVTNVIDAFVLTTEYDYLVRQWIAAGCDPTTTPTAPTDVDLASQFGDLEQYKMFSDEIIWRPVQYKYLFGSTAESAVQAQFKVVKIPNTTMSDGEIRSNIISAINTYFDVNKWEFGETFYFTELAAYVHIQLATAISSFVVVPLSPTSVFGNLFEVRCNSNELFISTAQVSDIVIINSNTASNLRIS
jgi:hypothetical protein